MEVIYVKIKTEKIEKIALKRNLALNILLRLAKIAITIEISIEIQVDLTPVKNNTMPMQIARIILKRLCLLFNRISIIRIENEKDSAIA